MSPSVSKLKLDPSLYADSLFELLLSQSITQLSLQPTWAFLCNMPQ